MRRIPLPALFVAASLAAATARAETAVTVVDDIPGACRLAAPATGQTLYVVDDTARSVTAIDPFAPAKRRRALGPADLDAGSREPVRPTAIACIDSTTLAVVCRAGAEWSLRSFRLAPSQADSPAPVLLQSLALGAGTGEADAVDVFVSDTRDWLAVVGLPGPLPRVLRSPIAGTRLGGLSSRLCPPAPSPDHLVAATCSPVDEWVMFVHRAGLPPGHTSLEFHANSGRQRLLQLDVGLDGIRDAAYCRSTGTLWVAASGSAQSAGGAGLWRIDAALEGGRQTAAAVAVTPLENPLSVACLSERAIALVGGGERRRVLLVNPTTPGDTTAP